MVSKKPPEPSLRTILERIDANGAELKAHGAAIEGLRARVDSHGALLEDVRIRVDSQNLLLEEMRSQNRATIEAVEAARLALERRIERLEQDTHARDALLEVAVRELRVSVQQNSLDIHDLAGKVETLVRLEERVAAIERRLT